MNLSSDKWGPTDPSDIGPDLLQSDDKQTWYIKLAWLELYGRGIEVRLHIAKGDNVFTLFGNCIVK